MQRPPALPALPIPAEIVIDEVAGQLISLFPLPLGLWLHGSNVVILPWPGVLAAFVLFRAFDILKPWPINQVDGLQSPAAIMLDDIAAGILAAVLVAILGAFAMAWPVRYLRARHCLTDRAMDSRKPSPTGLRFRRGTMFTRRFKTDQPTERHGPERT